MQTINRFNASLGIFCGPLKNPQSWRKFICGCSSIVACVQTSPIFFCFFVTFLCQETSERKLRLSYGDLGTRELEIKPVSNVVLLPCRAKLIELNRLQHGSSATFETKTCQPPCNTASFAVLTGSRRDMDHSCILRVISDPTKSSSILNSYEQKICFEVFFLYV